MIVLKGPQGCGKSTICERLSHGFYNEHINIEDPKYYVETLNRSWIVAFDELAGISRKDLSDIKSFLSKSSETVRLAYAHNPETYKRHCIFIGSTNEDNFLRDYTASIERRFWVIECTRDNTNNIVGSGFTEEIVDQIWAEAKASYQADP
jgi:predicted P-loop ATPase